MPDPQHRDLREDVRFVDLQATLEETGEWLCNEYQADGLSSGAAINEVLHRLETLIESVRGPVFDDAGFIPPIHVCNEADVSLWFGFTDQRRRLIDRVRTWIRLARAVQARRLLLDGSFVTGKDHPGDVDAVVLLPDDFRKQLRAENPPAVELHKMFRTREPKELFAAEDEADWWGWFGFFSRTREATGRCKGLIEVTL
jgi:hypothetical protein